MRDSITPTNEKYISPEWERIVADMQLFGSADQLKLIERMRESLSNGESVDPLKIVESMRKELREELGLAPAPFELTPFRVTRAPENVGG